MRAYPTLEHGGQRDEKSPCGRRRPFVQEQDLRDRLESRHRSSVSQPRKLLEALRESPPDLLILDLNSARFEPLTLLKDVRSDEATRDVSTVGFLSHVQKDLAVAAQEAGCNRVVARSAFTRDLPRILPAAPQTPSTRLALAEGGGCSVSVARGLWRPLTFRYARTGCGSLMVGSKTLLCHRTPRRRDNRPPHRRWRSRSCQPVPPAARNDGARPTGRLVEEDERPEEAAGRELSEETGYTGGESGHQGSVASSPSLKDNRAYLFLARGVQETSSPNPDEHELVVVRCP